MTEFPPSEGKRAETYDERVSLFHVPNEHERRLNMIVTLLSEAEGAEAGARLVGEALPPGAYEDPSSHQVLLDALKGAPDMRAAAGMIEPLLGADQLESLYVRMFFYPGRDAYTD